MRATVACKGGAGAALQYLGAIENLQVPTTELSEEIQKRPVLTRLDLQVYAAVLDCVAGGRRDAMMTKIRATVPFGHGAAAVRCMGREFQHAGARSKVSATAELLHLAPGGSSAAAMDAFSGQVPATPRRRRRRTLARRRRLTW